MDNQDQATREAIVAGLREQLKRGDKSLVGNKGYRKYLTSSGKRFSIDEAKVKSEARFDGKWVLQTDMSELSAEEVALKYKQLWMVEEMFRTAKTLLETRPIFHHVDDTIRGFNIRLRNRRIRRPRLYRQARRIHQYVV